MEEYLDTDRQEAEQELEESEEPKGSTKKNQIIIHAGLDKLAREVKEIPMDPKAGICDYFIIMTGRNVNHTRAIADAIEDKLAQAGMPSEAQEGLREGSWILLDCGETIVHVFTQDQRTYYDLEGLWTE